jgi:hypothetical protein
MRDIIGHRNPASDVTLENAAIAPFIITGMWLIAFFTGFMLFGVWHRRIVLFWVIRVV